MASISGICSSSSTIRRFKLSPFSTPHHKHHHLFIRPAQPIARETTSNLNQTPSLSLDRKKLLQTDPLPLWDLYVDRLYQHKDLGLFPDVSRIANPDEGRMVGHYWLRNPQLAPTSFLRSQIEKALDVVCRFAEDVIGVRCAEALAPDNPPLKPIRFIDNTDPAGIDHQIAQLGDELASTLVIVISKSGGTPETRNGLLEVQKAFPEAGLDFSKQDMVVLPYKDSLLLFSRYLQQLVMELLGKEFDLNGNRGTRSTLYANNHESITVTVQEVTPRSVGALIVLYERAIGIYA